MKKIISLLICIIILDSITIINTYAETIKYTTDDFYKIATDIIEWKKKDISTNACLICDKYLENANTTACDWYVIGMARLGIIDDYNSYLAVVKDDIKEQYTYDEKLSTSKSTEWHRAILTVLACKGNPQDLLGDNNINLVADGVYNRGLTASLGKQGINGWIWGLIAIDTMDYDIPEDSYYTREDIIIEIINKQLSDGGFALTGEKGDVDITAMAVQSLAPYYKNKSYSHLNIDTVIDNAINFLSKSQLENGGFISWGTDNVESIAQTIIALCSIGIDIQTDSRFIKNNNTMLDAIMRFRMSDGGFIHSFTYDSDNPTSQPDKSNSMAGEQVLLAMTALYRFSKDMNNLYDFTDIDFNNIDKTELTNDDIIFINKSLDDVTSQDYLKAVAILGVLDNLDNNIKLDYEDKINAILTKSNEIKSEIKTLNNDIYSLIYPLDKISASHKKDIENLILRYNSLHDLDKKSVLYYDDLITAKVKAESSQRAVIIAIILIIVVIVLVTVVFLRIRSRKKKRSLDDLCEDEE